MLNSIFDWWVSCGTMAGMIWVWKNDANDILYLIVGCILTIIMGPVGLFIALSK